MELRVSMMKKVLEPGLQRRMNLRDEDWFFRIVPEALLTHIKPFCSVGKLLKINGEELADEDAEKTKLASVLVVIESTSKFRFAFWITKEEGGWSMFVLKSGLFFTEYQHLPITRK